MNSELLILVLAAAVQAGTPILFATLGEIVAERSGVLNLGVEGMMVFGAFCGFFILYLTGNPWFSFFCSGVAGAFLAGTHGVVCLIFRGNQVVSGLTLTILGTGLADFLGTPYIGTITKGFDTFSVPLLSEIPFIGNIFFAQDSLAYVSYILVPVVWFWLSRTSWGLSLRATGENPAALAAAGGSPILMRWVGTLVGGFIVGLGGGYLSLAATHQWTNSITAGRGWIAVALVLFAFWKPSRAVVGAYLFGGIWVFQLRLQATGTIIPSFVLSMMPYLLTLAALLIFSSKKKQSGAPAALGINLEPRQ